MNRNSSVQDRIAAWLMEEAPAELPDRVLQAAFERTRAVGQVRRLPGWRHLPMFPKSLAFAVGAAAIVVAVLAGVALTRAPSTSVGPPASDAPSPAPSPTRAATPSPSPFQPVTGLPGRFAFSDTDDAGNFDIYTMNPDLTNLVRLTDDPAEDRLPAWSPDGSRIAFASNRDGSFEIWVMNADGSDQRRLTEPDGSTNAGEPSWSPDGRQIAFSRGNFDEDRAPEGVFVMNADGSDVHPLVLVGQHGMTVGVSQPLWSPDGTTILVRGVEDLYLIGTNGQGFRQLTTTDGEDSAGSWSPNGNWIAFESDADGGCIYRINPDGTGLIKLTTGCSQGFSMSWAPDSSRLAWAGGSHGSNYLHAIDPDGENEVRLTDTDVFEISWGPSAP